MSVFMDDPEIHWREHQEILNTFIFISGDVGLVKVGDFRKHILGFDFIDPIMSDREKIVVITFIKLLVGHFQLFWYM